MRLQAGGSPPGRLSGLSGRYAISRRREIGYLSVMPPWDDDDDWVGTPPEGRYTRDRAKPEYWRRPWPLAGAGMALLLVIVVIVLIVR